MPYANGVAAHTVAVTITSVSPDVDINRNGGQVITITGTGFPNEASVTKIEFTDGTLCHVSSASSTEIVCEIEEFSDSVSAGAPVKFQVIYDPEKTASRLLRRRNRRLFNVFPDIGGSTCIFGCDGDTPTDANEIDITVLIE